MGLFGCKHKEIKVITCDKNERYYIVRCLKCGYQWHQPKAVGEMYDTMHIIKRG